MALKDWESEDSPSSSYPSGKKSLCGPRTLTRLLISSKTSCPSPRSSQRLGPRRNSSFTSLRLLTWSVLPLSSNDRRKATHTQSSDPSTSSARSYLSPRFSIHRSRSYSTRFSLPRGSYDTTFRSTKSLCSLPSHLVTYYTTGILQGGSLSEWLSLALSHSSSSRALLSNLKPWQTSMPSGGKIKSQLQPNTQSIG